MHVLPPALSICVDYCQALNRSLIHHFEQFYKAYIAWYNLTHSEQFSTGITTGILTVSDIFNATPSPDDILNDERCNVVLHNSSSYLSQPSNCAPIFEIRKFYKERYICYSFEFLPMRDTDGFLYSTLSNTLDLSKMYFRLQVPEDRFDNMSQFLFFMTKSSKLPRGNSDNFSFSSRIRGSSRNPKFARLQMYDMSYLRFSSTLLPPPFQTRCQNYENFGFESDTHCYDACLMNFTLKEFDRVPFTTAVEHPYEAYHLGTKDIRNETLRKQLSAFEHICRETCSRPNCEEDIFIPKVTTKFIAGNFILFALRLPNEPDIIATAHPQLTAVDFITYILSCFSFWFGFSPLQLIGNQREKKVQKKGRFMTTNDVSALVESKIHDWFRQTVQKRNR